MGWVEIRSWDFGLHAIMFCKIYETFSNQSIHGGHRCGGKIRGSGDMHMGRRGND